MENEYLYIVINQGEVVFVSKTKMKRITMQMNTILMHRKMY